MKTVLLALGVILLSMQTAGADACESRVKDLYGVKYYNKCHCATLQYPDVAAAMQPLGVKTEPRWVVCTVLDGEDWCACGVRLSWAQKPTNKSRCERDKKEVKRLVDKFLKAKNNFAASYPLICPYK